MIVVILISKATPLCFWGVHMINMETLLLPTYSLQRSSCVVCLFLLFTVLSKQKMVLGYISNGTGAKFIYGLQKKRGGKRWMGSASHIVLSFSLCCFFFFCFGKGLDR